MGGSRAVKDVEGAAGWAERCTWKRHGANERDCREVDRVGGAMVDAGGSRVELEEMEQEAEQEA